MRSGRTLGWSRWLLTVLACGAAAAALAEQPPVSSIRVTADARVTAKPDRVQIDVGVTTRAALSQEAASQNAREVETVLAAVRKAAGPTGVLRTISYALTPNYRYHPKEGEPTIEGYTALNVVQVQLDDLTRIGAVIDAATQSGANRVQGIQFTLRDQDSIRAQALRGSDQSTRRGRCARRRARSKGVAHPERRGEQSTLRADACLWRCRTSHERGSGAADTGRIRDPGCYRRRHAQRGSGARGALG